MIIHRLIMRKMLEYMTENEAQSNAVTRASHVPKQPMMPRKMSVVAFIFL